MIEKQVNEELQRRGLRSTLEYPGFICIDISPAFDWHFGTDNDNWSGNLIDKDDDSHCAYGVDLGIESDSRDVKSICDAIVRYIRYET